MARQNRDIEALAQLCHILGDQTRLRILQALQAGEKNVTSMCQDLKLPQPTVSRHLAILRMAGLTNNRRAGKEIFYSLNDYTGGPAIGALKALMDPSAAVRIGPIIIGLVKK
jgi:ArsR family transcriptional regulator